MTDFERDSAFKLHFFATQQEFLYFFVFGLSSVGTRFLSRNHFGSVWLSQKFETRKNKSKEHGKNLSGS